MSAAGEELLRAIRAQDKILVAKGFHPLGPRWLRDYESMLRSPARTCIHRCGRQSGKSTGYQRVATATGVFIDHELPLGTRGVVAFVSVKHQESLERLKGIESILTALEVRYTRRDDEIELADRPIVFRAYPASFRTAVGMTAVALFADEMARWDTDGKNPAAEIVASMVPSMITQKKAFAWFASSPLGLEDYHAERFALGNTEHQRVFSGASWQYNPAITEEETHALCPDEKVHSREFRAIPSDAVSAAFDPEAVAACFAAKLPDVPMNAGERVLVCDPSSQRVDSWTWSVARWMTPIVTKYKLHRHYVGQGIFCWDHVRDPKTGEPIPIEPGEHHPPMLQFELLDGVEGRSYWKQVTGEQIVDRLAEVAREYGIRSAVGDQREGLMLSSMMAARGITYTPIDWTAASKPRAIDRVRRWMHDGQLLLPEHAGLRKELARFDEKITPSGAITFGGRGKTHDDYVALLITAAHADELSMLPSSPFGKYVRRDFSALAQHIGYTRA